MALLFQENQVLDRATPLSILITAWNNTSSHDVFIIIFNLFSCAYGEFYWIIVCNPEKLKHEWSWMLFISKSSLLQAMEIVP